MITREQFQLQIDRLVNCFGAQKFPDQRAAMIWDDVSGLPYATVIAIVDTFIRNAKHAPTPGDFLEAVKASGAQAKRYALGEIQPEEIARCLNCGDSGFIRLIRNEIYEEWAKWSSGSAPCHCYRGKQAIEAAKRKPKNPIDLGPQFNERWLKSYSINPAYKRKQATNPEGAA